MDDAVGEGPEPSGAPLPHPPNLARTAVRLLQSQMGRAGSAVPLPAFLRGTLAYTLRDLARDAFELLRRLDFLDADAAGPAARRVNIVGCSMGGMIAQHFVLDYGRHVNSLCLHATCADLVCPAARHLRTVVGVLTDKPPPPPCGGALYKAEVVDFKVRFFQALCGELPFSEDEFRRSMRGAVERCAYEGGLERQLHAIAADRDRTPLLRHAFNRAGGVPGDGHNRFPVLVLHGGADALLMPSCADHLACCCFHQAKLTILPRMGHYFPPCTFVTIADSILLNGEEGNDRVCRRARNPGDG
ncbi:esterase-like protein [Strigomonas culicis]|uniref:Esterase-like protein n=1 Tax=Strigomonas culicis TaxID=28005 RepID=S9UNG4_9TRYP|nr:esterase-like protein [Strigomonas culicis]|eukprot:EPY30269.1 esterase-like protein [Strigomonas culicis]